MRVNQLAKKLNVPSDTVRYYVRIGLLKPATNWSNGYKEYDEKDCHRLQFILRAKQLGFSLDDIKIIFVKAGKGKTPCPLVRQIIEKRLAETEKHFKEIGAMRKRMQLALKSWKEKPDMVPTGHMVCHLIESFEEM